MRNLLRSRRGSVAFATVIALIPLIGVLALGAEAGSWYVTKQRAQTAADAAAYAGGLKLACSQGVNCNDTQSVEDRAKQFAAQNTFCNAGDPSYPGARCPSLPSGTSRSVTVAITASTVQATVSQQQPVSLAAVLGLSTITIRATATAEVVKLSNPCVLALVKSISFQGSPTVTSPNCGLASNSTASDAISFKGNTGINISNAGTISAQGGCDQTGGTQCSKALTSQQPTPNLLSGLDSAIASLTAADFPDGKCPALPTSPAPGMTTIAVPAYGTAPYRCWYEDPFKNNKNYTFNGVYFFANGQISIQGGTTLTTPPGSAVTLILLPPKFVNASDPGALLKISGNPTIQITAPSNVTASQVPAKLVQVLPLMSNLLIYDPESTAGGVSITGSSTSFFSGITYVPNSPVTYQGSTQTSGCTMVIAYAITLSGNSSFDNTGCTNPGIQSESQYVRLVQ